MIDRHLNVRRIHCNQQRNQPPGRQRRKSRDQQQDTQNDFKHTAQINEQQMPWDIRWHDLHIESSIEEVIAAGQYEEDRK